MATDLQNRPDQDSDPIQRSYDNAFDQLTSPEHYNKDGEEPSASGEPADRGALRQAEERGGLFNPQGDRAVAEAGAAAATGAAALGAAEALGNGFNPADVAHIRSLKGFFLGSGRRRKATMGGGLAGLVLGGSFFALSVVSGPLQFIHLAQTLSHFHLSKNENSSDERTSRLLIYSLSGNPAKGRLGIVGNKAADKWEAKLVEKTGMRPVYSAKTGRLRGFEIVNDDKAFSTLGTNDASNRDKAVLEKLAGKGADFKNAGDFKGQDIRGINGKAIDPNTKILALGGDETKANFKEARQLTKVLGRQTGVSKSVSHIGSRLLIKRAGIDFHPLKNVKRKATDKLADYREERRKARDQEIKTGDITTVAEVEAEQTKDTKGNVTTNPDDLAAATEGDSVINQAKAAGAVGGRQGSELLKSIKLNLSKLAAPAAAVGIICAVHDFGKQVDSFNYENVQKLERYGASFVTLGSQVQSGQGLNLDELGAFSEDLYNQKDKTSWTNAKSIQAEQGQPQTGPDIAKEAKPSEHGTPIVFQAVDSIPFVGSTCGVAAAIGGLPIIKQVTGAISSLVSTAANAALGLFGYTIEGLLSSLIQLIAGSAVDLTSQGAALGNLANYGVKLMANDQAISQGGRALTNTEVAQLTQRDKANNPVNANIASRYLNPYDSNSLVASLIDRVPISFAQLGSTLASLPNIFQMAISSLATLLGGQASAGTSYDYGFATYGFSAAEQDDPRFDDPYANAAIVEPQLATLNQKYQDCFSTTIDPVTFAVSTGPSVNERTVNKDGHCTDGSDDLLRFRYYIADMVNATSAACYYGDEGSCSQMGFGGTSTAAAGTPAADQGALFQDSSNVPCAANTVDVGIHTGYTQGNPVNIRLCALPNMPSQSAESQAGNPYSVAGANGDALVNSRISGQFYQLVAAAAKDGVVMRAESTYRTMEHQQELCNQNTACASGDYTKVAKPGTSNHQMGLAIDFAQADGSSAIDTGDQWFNWLAANASKFGIKNYPVESWHWSATGN